MLKFTESETAPDGTFTVMRPSPLVMDPPSAPIVFVMAAPFGAPTGVGLPATVVRDLMNQTAPTTTTTATTKRIARSGTAITINNRLRDMVRLLCWLVADCCQAAF